MQLRAVRPNDRSIIQLISNKHLYELNSFHRTRSRPSTTRVTRNMKAEEPFSAQTRLSSLSGAGLRSEGEAVVSSS